MIVDYNKKYIFLGLYFSGSSAISKELIEQYGAETLFSKHTSIPFLQKSNEVDLKNFRIVAVVRDPIEMTFSLYNKMKTNHQNIYTDPKNLVSNGGWLTQKRYEIFKKVHFDQITFEQFLKLMFGLKKYNNDLSYNSKFITDVIYFENLNADFKKVFSNLGLEIVRDLQKFNITKKVAPEISLSQKLKDKYFGNFYYYNSTFFNSSFKPNLFSRTIFKIQVKLQLIKRLKYDEKLANKYTPTNYWD